MLQINILLTFFSAKGRHGKQLFRLLSDHTTTEHQDDRLFLGQALSTGQAAQHQRAVPSIEGAPSDFAVVARSPRRRDLLYSTQLSAELAELKAANAEGQEKKCRKNIFGLKKKVK